MELPVVRIHVTWPLGHPARPARDFSPQCLNIGTVSILIARHCRFLGYPYIDRIVLYFTVLWTSESNMSSSWHHISPCLSTEHSSLDNLLFPVNNIIIITKQLQIAGGSGRTSWTGNNDWLLASDCLFRLQHSISAGLQRHWQGKCVVVLDNLLYQNVIGIINVVSEKKGASLLQSPTHESKSKGVCAQLLSPR